LGYRLRGSGADAIRDEAALRLSFARPGKDVVLGDQYEVYGVTIRIRAEIDDGIDELLILSVKADLIEHVAESCAWPRAGKVTAAIASEVTG
jgi:hypothetical protein